MRYYPCLLLLLASITAHAETAPTSAAEPISLGYAHTVVSASMKEPRVVNVVLPPGYAKEREKRYPVLYLLDGGLDQDLLHVAGTSHLGGVWGRSADAIIVGIETRDRRKELAGPTSDPELLKRYPTAGSSASLRRFIRDEVKPLIAKTYRTNGKSAVLGESLAGLFIVETYLAEPQLFDAYAAIDPSLWWDKEALSHTAAAKVGTAQKGKSIYLAMAKEQVETSAAMYRVIRALKSADARWCLASRGDLLHSTIYQQVTPQALQFLLPPAEPPAPEFGFSVQCTERSSELTADIQR